MLLPHNVKVYNELEEALLNDNCCCVVMGTGVGKTYVTSEYLNNHNLKALVVSPRASINKSWEKHTDRVETVTYQKLANIYKDIDYSKYDLLICDEVHHIGAPTWGKPIKHLIDNKIIKVLGLTESSVRYTDGARDVAEEFFHGNIAKGEDVSSAIKKQILNPVTYVGAMYNSDGLKKTLRGKIQSRLYAKLNLVLNKTPTVQEVIRKNMPEGKRKGIIFASTIEDINSAMEFMQSIYPNVEIKFVHSKRPASYNNEVFEWFKNTDEGYVCSVDMISEGVHIKGVNTLIMLRRTESVNLFNQQLGRCLDASTKEPAILFDLVNNQYSIKVINDRVQIKTNSIATSGKLNVVPSEQLIIKDYTKDIVEVLKEIRDSLDRTWTEQEIQLLRDFMLSGKKGIREWAKQTFPDRTYSSVWSKISELGLACHNHYWTEQEIAVLKEWYHFGPEVAVAKLKELCNIEFTAQQVSDKANRLKIYVDKNWTEQEIKILTENYPKLGLSVAKLIPGKTKKECKFKAHQYGLRVEYEPSHEWTTHEIELLKKYYPTNGQRIPGLNRTAMSIQRKAKLLNIKYIPSLKRVECIETKIIYDSATEAAKSLNLGKNSGNKIRAVCNGKRLTAYGYHWRYVE